MVPAMAGTPRSTIILAIISDGPCYPYGAGSTALHATVDDTNVLIYVRHQYFSHDSDKDHTKSIMHRISNDYRIADSARAAVVSNKFRLSLYQAARAVSFPKLMRQMTSFQIGVASCTRLRPFCRKHNNQPSKRPLSQFKASLPRLRPVM
jgi:hypothetical protein